jgi:hypothetical protein
MTEHNFHAIEGPNGMCACGVRADGTVISCGLLLEEYVQRRIGALELTALVNEAAEIMQIVYAGNFPAGIESFLTRAHRAALGLPPATSADTRNTKAQSCAEALRAVSPPPQNKEQ